MRRAVFIDRDGVIICDSGYPHEARKMIILPGIVNALKKIKKYDYVIIVVSNQSGVARGLFTEKEVLLFNRILKKRLEKDGIMIDGFYFCPHHPHAIIKKYKKVCKCRKPQPGMLFLAAKEFNISLKDSWMIGDKEGDVVAGRFASCKTIKIGETKGSADFSAKNMQEVVNLIAETETDGKLVTKAKLLGIIKKAKRKRKKIVFTNGCFDILHAGHVDYLKKAKDLGDLLVIGLNSDESVKKIKGKSRPLNNELRRAKVLSALSYVDYIVIFEENIPTILIKDIKPDIHVKGSDWKLKKLPEKKVLDRYDGEIVFIDIVEDISTTEIINKIVN